MNILTIPLQDGRNKTRLILNTSWGNNPGAIVQLWEKI